jgi:hypothetical protein
MPGGVARPGVPPLGQQLQVESFRDQSSQATRKSSGFQPHHWHAVSTMFPRTLKERKLERCCHCCEEMCEGHWKGVELGHMQREGVQACARSLEQVREMGTRMSEGNGDAGMVHV